MRVHLRIGSGIFGDRQQVLAGYIDPHPVYYPRPAQQPRRQIIAQRHHFQPHISGIFDKSGINVASIRAEKISFPRDVRVLILACYESVQYISAGSRLQYQPVHIVEMIPKGPLEKYVQAETLILEFIPQSGDIVRGSIPQVGPVILRNGAALVQVGILGIAGF